MYIPLRHCVPFVAAGIHVLQLPVIAPTFQHFWKNLVIRTYVQDSTSDTYIQWIKTFNTLYMDACIHTHACTHARTHARTHTHTNAHTHAHMYAHTHAHTHMYIAYVPATRAKSITKGKCDCRACFTLS